VTARWCRRKKVRWFSSVPQHYRRETLAVASTVDEVPDAAAIVAGRGGDAAAANPGVRRITALREAFRSTPSL